MPGSASFDPPPVPPFAPPASFAVFKYVDRNASGDPEWTPLPWLVFVSHQERADSQPPLARLRYDFSEINPDAWPRRAHEAVDLSAAASPYRLNSDDRVVVFRTWADGSWKIVADGFAQLPQMTIERSEMVFVDVKDVSIRCFDMPIRGAVVRDAHGIDLPPGADPTALGVDEYEVRDIETEARVRFNPDGKPNATPDGVDGGPQDDTGAGEANEGKQYPVFVDWRLDREPDKRRFWTLDMAVRYLIGYYNRKEEFVINKQLGDLSGFLKAIVPTTEDGTINLDDNSSWEYEDIIVTDTDVTGMTWPDAVAHLIEPHGFILRFLCDQDPAVDDAPAPRHRWYILRRDSRLRRKTLLMEAPAPGITVDFGASNVAGLTMQRDYPRGNSVRVLCGRSRKEASFILSPAFMPAGPDAGEASRVVFGKGHPDFKENSVKIPDVHRGRGGGRMVRPGRRGDEQAADLAVAPVPRHGHRRASIVLPPTPAADPAVAHPRRGDAQAARRATVDLAGLGDRQGGLESLPVGAGARRRRDLATGHEGGMADPRRPDRHLPRRREAVGVEHRPARGRDVEEPARSQDRRHQGAGHPGPDPGRADRAGRRRPRRIRGSPSC
jgi:hypothetical protein